MADRSTPSRRPLRLFFVRHGESEANLLHEFSNRGQRHPLTERGRGQVESLAARLIPLAIQRIFCSPILRAIQSAQLLSERLGVGFEIAEALREFDVGEFEGTRDAANWEHYEQVLRDWMLEERTDLRAGGGESLEEIRNRFSSFVLSLPTLWRSGGSIVLVSHGGILRCALPGLLTNVTARYALANVVGQASWVLAEFQNNELRCLDWAGTEVAPGEVLDC